MVDTRHARARVIALEAAREELRSIINERRTAVERGLILNRTTTLVGGLVDQAKGRFVVGGLRHVGGLAVDA